jgi:uncharacterized membrane protein YcfT
VQAIINTTEQRTAWVDFAKGICILAVVSLYAQGKLHAAGLASGWLDAWVAFAKPFRMPDFFLLSGLFLARVINRPWRSYLDTKVVHYLYFLLLWIVIFFPVSWQDSPWPMSASGLTKFFAYQLIWPHAMLWFILVLPAYFVFTRLTRSVPVWVMLLIGVGLHLIASKTGIKIVEAFCERYVFFYAGYAFATQFFNWADWARKNTVATLVGLLAWVGINGWLVHQGFLSVPGVALLLGFAGAMAVIAVGSQLSRFDGMRWLSYVGQHSIVVYLGFYLPLVGLAWLGSKFGLAVLSPNLFALLAIAASTLAAFCIYWLVRGSWAGFLFDRPRWAHIDFWLGRRSAPAARSA